MQYAVDESRLAPGCIESLARPHSLGQLAQAIAWHHERGHAMTISGGRTGVVGGAVVTQRAHVISTERMSGVQPILWDESGTPYTRVLAGTPLSRLNEHIAHTHPELFFPVDPSETSATLGGMVSTNASGTRSLRYGPMRSWVRALDVVLADGRVVHLRRGAVHAIEGVLWLISGTARRRLEAAAIRQPSTKHAIGYHYNATIDPIDLFIGAEGTLGVVAEIEVALATRPSLRVFHLQFVPSDEVAFDLVDRLRAADGIVLAAVEYLDQASLSLLSTRVPVSRCRFVGLIDETCGAAIYCEIELRDASQLDRTLLQLADLVHAAGGSIDRSVTSTEDADWRAIKTLRHAVPEQINALIAERKRLIPDLHKISTDMSVGDLDLRAIHAFYRDILVRHGLQHFIFGHIGENHFHVNIVPRDARELQLTHVLYQQFAAEVARRGGAVAAEHGIGRIKARFSRFQYSARELEALRRIKRFFDPKGLLNRGVLLNEDLPPDGG